VKIIVCRYETIQAVNTALNATIYVNPLVETKYTVNNMFTTNDSYCPANRLSLQTTAHPDPSQAGTPTVAQLETFNIKTEAGQTILHLNST